MNKSVILTFTGYIIFIMFNCNLPAALVAHWSMDDNADNRVVADSSSYGNTGNAIRNTSLLHTNSTDYPHLDGAFRFNGSSDYIDCPNNASLGNFTAKTVLLWFKAPSYTNSSNYRQVYDDSYWNTDYGDRIYLGSNKDEAAFNIRNTDNQIASRWISFTPGKWVMLGYSWNGTNITYYKNGVKSGVADSFTGTLACTGRAMIIGRYPLSATWFFNGEMDSFRVYNESLNENEISQIYLDDLPVPDLVAHWTLDDNQDNKTVIDSIGVPGHTGMATRNTSLMHTNSGHGHLNSAFSFDIGLSDYVDCGNSACLQNFTQKTVLMWMKVSIAYTGVNRYLYNNGYWDSPYGDLMHMHSGLDKLRINLRNTSGFVASEDIPIPDDKWTFVGYSWDGTNVTYYINGMSVISESFTGIMSCASVPLRLGKRKTGEYYDGALDDVRIYRRALSAQEMAEIYDSAFVKGTYLIVQ